MAHLHLIVLKTREPEHLAAFYGLLGFTFTHHKHGNGPLHFAADVNGLVFEIYPLPASGGVADNTLRLGFTVDNIESLMQKIKAFNGREIKVPVITEWGYQTVIEDPDGRKIELKESGTGITSFQIESMFRITGRGLVVMGTILSGSIHIHDELIFAVNGITRRRRITAIEDVRKHPITHPVPIGLIIECLDEAEIEELRTYAPAAQVATVKNQKPFSNAGS